MTRNVTSAPSLSERGNALIYVLIALALLGILTATLASQNSQSDEQNMSSELTELYANELINYAGSAQQVIDMMLSTSSEIDDLDFITPSNAAFNTPPNIHKVYHPQGGGLNYAPYNEEISTVPGSNIFYIKNTTNVEWTPTTANDVLLSTIQMKRAVCEAYNKKVTGNISIPILPNTLDQWLVSTSTNDLTVADCPACEGYPTLCVANNSDTSFGIYYIIAAQ